MPCFKYPIYCQFKLVLVFFIISLKLLPILQLVSMGNIFCLQIKNCYFNAIKTDDVIAAVYAIKTDDVIAAVLYFVSLCVLHKLTYSTLGLVV